MATAPADSIIDSLISDFGGNYVFALDLLEQYRQDPSSVETSWRSYFDGLDAGPASPAAEAEATAAATEPDAAAPARDEAPDTGPIQQTTEVVRSESPAQVARQRSRALVVPAILPGDIAQPIRGGAVRVVENMEASLAVPTATLDARRCRCGPSRRTGAS